MRKNVLSEVKAALSSLENLGGKMGAAARCLLNNREAVNDLVAETQRMDVDAEGVVRDAVREEASSYVQVGTYCGPISPVVELMDAELRDAADNEGGDDQAFVVTYMAMHKKKFGEDFVVS